MRTQHDIEQEAAYYDGLDRESRRLEAENEQLKAEVEALNAVIESMNSELNKYCRRYWQIQDALKDEVIDNTKVETDDD